MARETIQYGIGKDYLPDWGIKEALREIFQNYFDYGVYNIREDILKDKVRVEIYNNYTPTSYEFLQIGKSIKSGNAIGKHGEGLKMAFMILLRENLFMQIRTQNKRIIAKWNQSIVGETLALDVITTKHYDFNFNITFICPIDIYEEFKYNTIADGDIIFKDSYHGSIVNKPQGNLYSGRLFVCHLKNLKKAYDIPPNLLSLDRDRKVPQAFEVSYHTSNINTKQAEFDFVDQNYSDMQYTKIPKDRYKDIKPVDVGGKIEYVAKVIDKETNIESEVLITNQEYKSQLKSSSFFDSAISKIKRFLTSALGIDDLLLNFRKKYCTNKEARQDFDIILEKLNIKIPDEASEDYLF